MDKRAFRNVSVKRLKRNIILAAAVFARTLFGFFCCFIGIYLTIFTAENGSDIFYYALAFASPGTAIEFLQNRTSESIESENAFNDLGETFIDESDESNEVLFPETPEISVKIPTENQGKVTEKQYSAKEGGVYVAYKNALIKNCTSLGSAKIKSILETEHSISLTKTEEPQVLIYHTHATEGYENSDTGIFDTTETWRSTDPDKNMIAVGDVLTKVLTENKIGVIHDGTMHDDPSYKGSYGRSAVTISKHLEENPEIVVCLDIHRDAIEPSSSEIIKPTAVINGKKAAQIMIISGCDDGNMNMPNYAENLRFAAAIANKLEELYPGLSRPILFDYRKYNMDLSPGLLLIEIGSTGNTLEEAMYSAELLGNALVALFSE